MTRKILSEATYRVRYKISNDFLLILCQEIIEHINIMSNWYIDDNKLERFEPNSTWHMQYCDGILTLNATDKCPLDFRYYLNIAFKKAVRVAKKKCNKNA